ncbi:MAG: LPS assembly lipoprotein LptE [Saprospiraceae bacterium]|nr:LPS assembly lipoprotein LptE [Saprospiraceae bacterium]
MFSSYHSKLSLYFVLTFCMFLWQGCHFSMFPGKIDSSLKTFSVSTFDVQAGEAPATSGQDFSELLKARMLNRTNLAYQDDKGDLSFSGNVVKYDLQPLAVKPNETSALQRLSVSVSVECKNLKDDDKTWQQTFSRFEDFGADENLADVQDALLTSIYDQIGNDVFNKLFADW